MKAVVEADRAWNRRVATARLNRWLGEVVAAIRRRRSRGGASRFAT